MSQNDFIQNIRGYNGEILDGRHTGRLTAPDPAGYFVSGFDGNNPSRAFVGRVDDYGNVAWVRYIEDVTYDRMVMEVDYGTGAQGNEVFVALQVSGSVWLYKFDHAGDVVAGWPVEVTQPDFIPTAMKPVGTTDEEFGLLSIHQYDETMFFTKVHGDIGHPSMTNGTVFSNEYNTPYHEKGANVATFVHKDFGNDNILIIYGTFGDLSEIATFEIEPTTGAVQTSIQFEYLEIGPEYESGKIDLHDAKEIINPQGLPLILVVGAQLDRPLALFLDNNTNLWHLGVEIFGNFPRDKNHLVAINESNVEDFNFLGVSFWEDSFYANGSDPAPAFMASMRDVTDGFSPLPSVFVTEVRSSAAGFTGQTRFPATFDINGLSDPVVAMHHHASEMPIVFFDGINLSGGCSLNALSPKLFDTQTDNVRFETTVEDPFSSVLRPTQIDVLAPMPRDNCGNICPVNNLAVTFTTTGCLSTGTLDITANVTGNVTTPPTFIWYPSGATGQTLSGVSQPGLYEVSVSDPANGCHIMASIVISDFEVTVTVDDEECDGICDAQVMANPTGGTPPYTYLWTFGGATTQTVTGLCNNSGFGPPDNVTVTDANGCTVVSAPVNIGVNQPGPGFSYTTNTVDASCFGACDGEAEFILTPPPGTVPGNSYSFNWNDANNDGPIRDEMCEGSYTVTITHSNAQGDCELTENVTINYTNPSDWHKQSTNSILGSNNDMVVNDIENDMGHVYVYGTFEDEKMIDGVTINSGNGQSGVYVIKYDRCGTMEWVAYTDATGYNVGFTAVDIEYRYNELHLLMKNDNALLISQQPHLRIKDNAGNDILNPGGIPFPGAPFNVAPSLSDGEYVIGRINNAGTFAQLDPLYLEMDADDKLTSLDYIENPTTGTMNYYVAGRHSNQAYIAELEFFSGTPDFYERDANYAYGHSPGSGSSNDFDIINDIERYDGVGIVNNLIYVTGRYESAGLFNSTIPAVQGDYDAFMGAMDITSLPAGFDFLGTGGNEYVIEGGSEYRAEGIEIDYREISGNYQPIVIGDYQMGVDNYGLVPTSHQINTFISYFEDVNTHIIHAHSATFEDNFVQSPNNFARGKGIIINPVEEKLYATGEFTSWNDLIAEGQPYISIQPNEWVKNMWVAELDLEANFQWLGGGLAPTGTPITHSALQTPQGVRSNGVATVGKRAFVGGYANIRVDLEPSMIVPNYANSAVLIAPVGVVHPNLEMYTVRIGELSAGSGGVFHKRDPHSMSNENDAVKQPYFETRVMPNPSNGEVRIELQSNDDENWNISVFNAMGQQVVEVSNLRVENSSVEMNWTNLAAGMYLVRIQQGNQTATQKLIVR